MMSDLDRRASETFHPVDEGAPRPSPWFWPVLLAIAFLVYELTAQPGLGAAIACTKFGWDDFLTARWLRRRDPDRRRGKASFWLFVAAGLWKTAVTGVVVLFAVAFIDAMIRRRGGAAGPPPAEALAGAFATALV